MAIFWQFMMDNFLIQGVALGVLGGVHCVYMCTPVALFFTQRAGVGYVLIYHISRIWAYAIMGMLAGVLGAYVFQIHWFNYFSILVGVLIIANAFQVFKRISLFSKIHQFLMNKAIDTKSNFMLKYVFLGMANGFLPCGLSATAVLASSITIEPYLGLLFMIAFGVGTSITLFSAQYITKLVLFQKLKPNSIVISFFIGVLLIVRGLDLGIPLISPSISQSHSDNKKEKSTICVTINPEKK